MNELIVPCVVAGLCVAGAWFGAQSLATRACAKGWQDSMYESRYVIGAGCQIYTDKGWIPVQNLREM